MSSRPAPAPIASQVDIFKTKAAAKRGVGALDGQTETIWPKPEFGASTKIEFITKAGKEASGFTLPAGSMFPLGCAIPNHTTLQHGMYFPPGSMFPDGVLVPIHARMVSVQPIQTLPELPPASEMSVWVGVMV